MESESSRATLNLSHPLHVIVSLETKVHPVIRACLIHDSQATEVSVECRENLAGHRGWSKDTIKLNGSQKLEILSGVLTGVVLQAQTQQ